MVLYKILAFIIHGKIQKSHTEIIKYQLQHGMTDLNYLTDHIQYQMFKTILIISSKIHETVTDNPPIKIYGNKIKNRITFRTQTGYYPEILTTEAMILLK